MKNLFVLLFLLAYSSLSAQWEHAGPAGVRGDVLLAQNGSRIFALSYGNRRLSSSVTNGLTWEREDTKPNHPFPDNFPYPIVVAADASVVVFVSEDFSQGNTIWYRSLDGGSTWLPMHTPNGGTDVFVDNGNIYYYGDKGWVTGSHGLYQYNTATDDWDLLQLEINYQPILAFTGAEIWMGSSFGMWHLQNGSWTTIIMAVPPTSLAAVGTTLAGVSGNDVFYSNDNGATRLPSNLSGPGFRVFADEGEFYAISEDKAYRSLDNGMTYNPILTGLGTVDNLIAFTVGTNKFWLASTAYGAYQCLQGTNDWTWVSLPNSYNDEAYLKAAGEVLFFTQAQTAFSMDYGSNWKVTNGLHKFDNFAYDVGTWYARKGLEVWSSVNLTDWVHSIADLPAGTTYWAFLGGTFFCNAGAGVYTYNSGTNQWALSGTLPSGAYTLFIHNNVLYGHLTNAADLIRLDNFGQAPQTYTGVFAADPNVVSFMSAPGKLYAVSQSNLLVSNDDGLSFTKKPWPGNMSDAKEGCLYFDNGFVINNDDAAMYYSHGEAESWTKVMNGYSGYPNYAHNGFLKLNDAVFSVNTVTEPFRRYDFDNSTAQYSGNIYQDLNGNNLPDVGEPPLPNAVLHLDLSNTYANSGTDGSFNISSELQTQTLTPVSVSPYCTFVPSNYTVNASSGALEFAFQCTAGIRDLGLTSTNGMPYRPGFDTDIFLTVNNIGTVAADGVLTLTLDADLQSNVISTTPPATLSGNVLTWPPITGLASMDHLNYIVRVKTPVGTAFGTEICNQAEITTLGNDNNPLDNINSTNDCPKVVGSFDPNDKQVDKTAYKPGTQPPLTYTVRFQNTGTYLASFVVIKDTLSPYLDPSTIQLLGSSHPLTWSLRGNGIMEFRFDGINLPDMNSDEPGSHGFVQFSVLPRENQPLGLMTQNTAFIYFDFNEPIITNTVTSTVLSAHEPVNTIQLIAQPNPAYETLRLIWPEGQAPKQMMLYVQDVSGRLVKSLEVDQQDVKIDVRDLKTGAYQAWGNDGQRQFSAMFEVIR